MADLNDSTYRFEQECIFCGLKREMIETDHVIKEITGDSGYSNESEVHRFTIAQCTFCKMIQPSE